MLFEISGMMPFQKGFWEKQTRGQLKKRAIYKQRNKVFRVPQSLKTFGELNIQSVSHERTHPFCETESKGNPELTEDFKTSTRK